MITYFANNGRLFIHDRGANASFSTQDITREMIEAVRTSDITFVSGYSLLAPDQASAVMQLVEEANNAGKFTVLDVVPHQIFKFIDRPTFQTYTRFVSLLITEFDTIKHFLPDSIDASDVDIHSTAKHLLKQHRALILRC